MGGPNAAGGPNLFKNPGRTGRGTLLAAATSRPGKVLLLDFFFPFLREFDWVCSPRQVARERSLVPFLPGVRFTWKPCLGSAVPGNTFSGMVSILTGFGATGLRQLPQEAREKVPKSIRWVIKGWNQGPGRPEALAILAKLSRLVPAEDEVFWAGKKKSPTSRPFFAVGG